MLLGCLLALLGLLCFTPATDLLPAEILSAMRAGHRQTFYRAVLANGDTFVLEPAWAMVGAALVLGGGALIAMAMLGRRRRAV
jgi:hypothetical protein